MPVAVSVAKMALSNHPSYKTWRIPWHLLLIFSLLAIGILSLGFLFYQYQVTSFQNVSAAELNAIADLKVKQIMAWRRDRMNDAQLIVNDPLFASQVYEFFHGEGSTGQREKIGKFLSDLNQGSYVAVALLDDQKNLRLSIFEVKPERLPLIQKIASDAMRTQKVILSDLYRPPQGEDIFMNLAIPIKLAREGKEIVVGAVVYEINPHYFLFPLIHSWPNPSKTAEAVMVRRETSGKGIIFLSDLRYWKGPHLGLRKSLTEIQMVSVKAVLGELGIVRGTDYRGAPVLAANRIIPDSPWYLTAKIDIAEVNAPLHRWLYLIPILTIAMMAAAGLGVALIWRNRDVQLYRQQYESELERRALSLRYEYLTKFAHDIILVTDMDGKIIEANDTAVDSYGYSREELFILHLWDLFEDSSPSVTGHEQPAEEARNGLRFEGINRRQDGTTFPVEISASLVEMGDKRIHQYIIRDISERKLKEKILQESEQQLRFFSSQLLIVQENERRRISKELHDELGPALMILKFHLSSIETKLPKNKKALRNEFESLPHYVDDIIENVRRLSWDLNPTVLEQFGLATAVKNLLEDFGKQYCIRWEPPQVEAINDLFPPLSQTNIYRIFQEALTNIGRHAQATEISIGIEKHDGYVTFTLEDNGRGFDPQVAIYRENRQKGIGLAAMQERARMAGGRLEIRSRPGQGTHLALTIPLENGE
jgi:PAS domain S-box-containing protein